jgi:hypothetical protein
MSPYSNHKGKSNGAKTDDGRGGSDVGENLWKCSGFKGCCYYRFNTMDDAVCYACKVPWTQGMAPPTRANTPTPTSNRFSALDTKEGGKGFQPSKGKGKNDDSRHTWAQTRRPLDGKGGHPKTTPPGGKADPWHKHTAGGGGARDTAHGNADHLTDASAHPTGTRRTTHEGKGARGKGKHKAKQQVEQDLPFDEDEPMEAEGYCADNEPNAVSASRAMRMLEETYGIKHPLTIQCIPGGLTHRTNENAAAAVVTPFHVTISRLSRSLSELEAK